jgi:flagellar biosynthesis protein FliR
MKTLPSLIDAARKATPAQCRIALALLVGLLLLVPSLPAVVMVPAATVAVWAAAQPLLVGMGLGAYALHRRRKVGAR